MLVMLILIGITVWLVSVQKLVKDYALTERQFKQYKPARVRWVTLGIGLICAAGIFVSSCLIQLFSNVQLEVDRDETNLKLLEYRIGDFQKRLNVLRKEETNWYLYYLEHAAEMMSRFPELRNQESLRQLNDVLGGEYVTLFDSAGKAIVCSAGYKDFALATEEKSPTSDFRRLLMGAPGIAHEQVKDPVLGETLNLLGVTVPLSATPRSERVRFTRFSIWGSLERKYSNASSRVGIFSIPSRRNSVTASRTCNLIRWSSSQSDSATT